MAAFLTMIHAPYHDRKSKYPLFVFKKPLFNTCKLNCACIIQYDLEIPLLSNTTIIYVYVVVILGKAMEFNIRTTL